MPTSVPAASGFFCFISYLVSYFVSNCFFFTRWFQSSTEGKFFEQEFQFYSCCGEALTSLAVYLLTTLAILLGSRGFHPRPACDYFTLLTGLLLSYCTSFLKVGFYPCYSTSYFRSFTSFPKLVALLWATPETSFLWAAVDLLFLVTTVASLQVPAFSSIYFLFFPDIT